MKTENPISTLRATIAAARTQANSERETIRSQRLQAERIELVIPDGTGPVDAAKLEQEHHQHVAALRNVDRQFDVVDRTSEILDADSNLPLLKAAVAHLIKMARAAKPQRPTSSDDDAPKPLNPVSTGGLFGIPEIIPPLERLAAVEHQIAEWPAVSFSKIAAELMAVDQQLQVAAKVPQAEPWRQSFPQRMAVS